MSMSPAVQPLHIFRKDAIHLWPETLISMALLVAYAWAEARTWQQPVIGANNSANMMALLMVVLVWIIIVLMLVAWLVLTSRLVHDEELVGDRQFWITRPYTWYGLLSSKVLYLFVLVGVPFVAMQMWLLHHAGLYPTHLLPLLAKNLLLIAAVFLLPLLAIAAVTATFVRYMLSVLAGFIYLIVVVVITGYNWGDKLGAPYLDHVVSFTLLAVLVAALVLQYARRKTMIARLMLLAVPLLFIALTLLTPANLLSEHRYPEVSAGKLSFIAEDAAPHRATPLIVIEHKNILGIPVQVQLNDTSDNSFVQVERVRFDIDGPNGFHYSSDWSDDRATFSPEENSTKLPFALPEKVFQQIRSQPVAIHFQIGTQTFNVGKAYTVPASEKPFPIPGNATCTVSTDGGLECHFPFSSNPRYLLVTATVHNGSCQAPGPYTAPASGGFEPSIPWPIYFSPVEIARTSLSVGENKVPLCPGIPVTFKTATEGAYGRMHLDIPSITLDSYAIPAPTRPAQNAPQPQQ
jgi:hypothetical protein